MLRLSKLSLKNFRSFVDAEIEFPASGLVLLKGLSGAGKSNVLCGIAFALGYSGEYTKEDLQSYLTEEPMQVVLELNDSESDLIVKIARGKANYIALGHTQITGAKAIAAKIQELLKISPEVLGSVLFRPQRTNGLFLSKNNIEKLEFLGELLGLSKIETAVELSQGFIKDYGQQIAVAKKIIEIETPKLHPVLKPEDLDSIESMKLELHRLTQEDISSKQNWEKEIQKKVAEIDSSMLAIKTIKAQIGKQLDEAFDTTISKAKGFLQELVVSDEKRAKELNLQALSKNRKVSELTNTINNKTKEVAILERQNEAFRRMACNACNQAISSAEAQQKLDTNVSNIAKLENEIIRANADLSETNSIVIDTFTADSRIEQFRELIASKTAEKQKALLEQTAECDKQLALLSADRAKVIGSKFAPNEEFGQLLSKLSILQLQAQIYEQNESIRQAIDQQKQIKESLTKKMNLELDFVRLVGRLGFMGTIVAEVLEEIAVETNKMLANIPNVEKVTLGFDIEKNTVKGEPKKAIVPFVTIDGCKSKLSSLSGGMLSSLELAVDLSIITVVQRRAGIKTGWLAIDEAFDGQGASKESTLDLLSQFAHNKLVLVVDHGSEFVEMFSNVIQVVKENDGSTTIVAN